MYDELHKRIEIFLERRVRLIHRHELVNLKLDISNNWNELLSNVENSTSNIIRELWKPAETEANDVVNMLAGRIKDLLIVQDMDGQSPAQLCYLFVSRSERLKTTSENAWIGGPPLDGSIKRVIQEKSADILAGSGYEKFLQIHNGFLLDGNGAIGLFPTEKLEFFSAPRDHRRLIAFCGDGRGNLQCFDVQNSSSALELMTVDWDHETAEPGESLLFWGYINRFLTWNTGTV